MNDYITILQNMMKKIEGQINKKEIELEDLKNKRMSLMTEIANLEKYEKAE